jgi:hypothetical protein
VKQLVDNTSEVQGIVKPVTGLMTITKSLEDDINKLTKNDVVLVLGGTKDVGRNDTRNGLNLLQDFVRYSCHTYVILMCAPHKHDLHVNSCVNR